MVRPASSRDAPDEPASRDSVVVEECSVIRRLPTLALVAVAVLFTTLGAAGPAEATRRSPAEGPSDAMIAWSGYSAQALSAGQPPASANVQLGIVHVAMYDTVVALGLRTQPFLIRVPVRLDTSAPAAIAAAAYTVLVARLPSQRPFLDATYQEYLAGIPDGAAKSRGVELGRRVAATVLSWRAGDGMDRTVAYVQPTPGPGVWEPTAPAAPVDLVLTQVRPLTLRAVDQLRPAGPLPLGSRQYARDVTETQDRGRVDSTTRTAQQTQVAQFWAENTAIQWHRTVLRLATAKRLNLGQTARMLAMVFVSAADAGIACFDAKFHFMAWRPVHAVQRADTDGNPGTVADPTWRPLLNVNHPEYPSGHACLTGAVTAALTGYFHRDRVAFTMDSTVTGTQVRFGSFDAALDQVTEARIDSGLHFRHSMRDGSRIGYRAAAWVLAHQFRT
jgi:hypothetical protein